MDILIALIKEHAGKSDDITRHAVNAVSAVSAVSDMSNSLAHDWLRRCSKDQNHLKQIPDIELEFLYPGSLRTHVKTAIETALYKTAC